jgi:hypothetical protein
MKMRLALGLTLCVLMLAGCEGGMGGVVECHGQNWYRLGLNDGKAGAQGERERYVKSCGPDFNEAQYRQGFEAGSQPAK